MKGTDLIKACEIKNVPAETLIKTTSRRDRLEWGSRAPQISLVSDLAARWKNCSEETETSGMKCLNSVLRPFCRDKKWHAYQRSDTTACKPLSCFLADKEFLCVGFFETAVSRNCGFPNFRAAAAAFQGRKLRHRRPCPRKTPLFHLGQERRRETSGRDWNVAHQNRICNVCTQASRCIIIKSWRVWNATNSEIFTAYERQRGRVV